MTNRWLGLPIFALVMYLVYWVAMVGVGAPATDWANDGLFGDGWHLLGIGTAEYTEVSDNYTAASEPSTRSPALTPALRTSTRMRPWLS